MSRRRRPSIGDLETLIEQNFSKNKKLISLLKQLLSPIYQKTQNLDKIREILLKLSKKPDSFKKGFFRYIQKLKNKIQPRDPRRHHLKDIFTNDLLNRITEDFSIKSLLIECPLCYNDILEEPPKFSFLEREIKKRIQDVLKGGLLSEMDPELKKAIYIGGEYFHTYCYYKSLMGKIIQKKSKRPSDISGIDVSDISENVVEKHVLEKLQILNAIEISEEQEREQEREQEQREQGQEQSPLEQHAEYDCTQLDVKSPLSSFNDNRCCIDVHGRLFQVIPTVGDLRDHSNLYPDREELCSMGIDLKYDYTIYINKEESNINNILRIIHKIIEIFKTFNLLDIRKYDISCCLIPDASVNIEQENCYDYQPSDNYLGIYRKSTGKYLSFLTWCYYETLSDLGVSDSSKDKKTNSIYIRSGCTKEGSGGKGFSSLLRLILVCASFTLPDIIWGIGSDTYPPKRGTLSISRIILMKKFNFFVRGIDITRKDIEYMLRQGRNVCETLKTQMENNFINPYDPNNNSLMGRYNELNKTDGDLIIRGNSTIITKDITMDNYKIFCDYFRKIILKSNPRPEQ